MTPHETLLAHPQPVDKTAALHIAGGDRTNREELLWAQHGAFERAMTEARLRNMEDEQKRQLEFARVAKKLETLPAKSHYTWDYTKHVNKQRSRLGVTKKRERVLRSLHSGACTVDDLGYQGRAWAQTRMGSVKEKRRA